MENSGLVLIDTNIVIEYFKNNLEIINKLKIIGEKNIVISEVTFAELIFGARNKQELVKIQETISTIIVFNVNKEISILAIELMIKFSLSHRLSYPDALIAATAIQNNLTFYTLNTKDFRYLDISLYN